MEAGLPFFMILTKKDTVNEKKLIVYDIKKQLIWAFIVNLGIGIGIIIQMYFNQKLIMYRLDIMEANQEAINAEIINLYKYAR